MAEFAASEKPPAALVLAPLPFSSRINAGIRLWMLKLFAKVIINVVFFFKHSPPDKLPTYIKTYPVRPTIRNRVFIPSSYKAGGSLLPLYIDVHGGGFALCDPRVDDDYCSYMAQKHGICVVSIGYRRAPRFPFPNPDLDVACLAQAVLEDPELPCDKSRVAIGGFSAGAKLSFSACQIDGLGKKLEAVVAYYPVVDFTRNGERKLKTRPVTPNPDALIRSGNWLNWAYIPQGTDRVDPLLSPIFANREDLPRNICMFGCEFDLLREEAEDMANIIADKEIGEKKSLKIGEGWEKGNVRWEKVLGEEHGFDQMRKFFDKVAEEARLQRSREMYDDVAEWLFRKVYA
ncbi:hypothetical protein MMC13_005331 [Lambiella insularis]|nr:hypothetical protein [Lambiella insularis]